MITLLSPAKKLNMDQNAIRRRPAKAHAFIGESGYVKCGPVQSV